MGADAAGKGRRDAGVIQIELRVANECLGVVGRRLGGAPVGRSLVGGFDAAAACLLHRIGAESLAVREVKPRTGAFEPRRSLAQFDLIGRRVDREQQVAFMDDVTVLEADLGQRAADLCSQLDLIDG
jgi:hypothetical protein